MQARKLIFALSLVLTTSYAVAQFRTPAHGAFIPVNDNWIISEKSKVGAKTRVQSRDQNPYPFCFSFAASILFDQQRCMSAGTDCSKQERSSSLAATPAGQNLPPNEIDIKQGGVGSRSLKHLLENGFVPDAQCNHNVYNPEDSDYQNNLGNQLHASTSLEFFQQNWLKYSEYTPYLERFYRFNFISNIKKISPDTNSEELLSLLKTSQNMKQLMGTLLLKPACFNNIKIENNYNIQTKIIESEKSAREVFQHINKLLDKKIPVFTGICTGDLVDGKCSVGSTHAVVVVARSIAISKITGDRRTVYWIVNTWGETWQEKNADGWVFGESFAERIIGEIVWLEKK